MASASELFSRLREDPEFVNGFAAKVKAVMESSEDKDDNVSAIIKTASEYGYEVTPEDIEAQKTQLSEELSEDELGKVAGGSTPVYAIFTIAAVAVTFMTYGIYNGDIETEH